ncbi:DUF4406 domain-containing protein (plasmid) [Kovacikia minuta CCNUW1]|uniref:DUF4406 domain-containing protein n=1 Tax=Kovacikia minuta TaxID=2931930 RepID=UPI001CCDD7A9|nr:DUF4406 domain-containing protein [Kovacikia minuta]UBF29916.1 DUF4406 domain-containing protein [Kovacikia minuta CCNUW1]
MKYIAYIGGPYRATESVQTSINIDKSREAALELWEKGYAPLCPHLNSAHFEWYLNLEDKEYLEAYLSMLARCDLLVLIPGWEKSEGTLAEKELAESINIPVFELGNVPSVVEFEKLALSGWDLKEITRRWIVTSSILNSQFVRDHINELKAQLYERHPFLKRENFQLRESFRPE